MKIRQYLPELSKK